MNTDILQKVAKQMVAKGKGILAADESVASAGQRLSLVGVPSTEESRRQYRELFLGTAGLGNYISGVILHDETMRQKSDNGLLFPDVLKNNGILTGIKVDMGLFDFPGFGMEKMTLGLDTLKDRLVKYRDMGATFTKWRSVVTIGDHLPTEECLRANAIDMARYSRIVQDEGLVPIVEPEVLLTGSHTVHVCENVLNETLRILFEELKRYKVFLPGLILKTSMVLPGDESGETVQAGEVARRTVRVLKKRVPKDVPGIVFLSGGQEPMNTTLHLNAIAKLEPLPWEIAFSYARAIQSEPLSIWKGRPENLSKARQVLLEILKRNVEADKGMI